MSEAECSNITRPGRENVTLPPAALALSGLCRLAAEAEREANHLDRASIEARHAGDIMAAERQSHEQQTASQRMLALDDLATHYPAMDLPGALYAVALACQTATELDCPDLDTAEVLERARRILRLLMPVVPLLRDAAGEEASDLDVSRLLPAARWRRTISA